MVLRNYPTPMRAREVRQCLMRMSLHYSAIKIIRIYRVAKNCSPVSLIHVYILITLMAYTSTEANVQILANKRSKFQSFLHILCNFPLYFSKSFHGNFASHLNRCTIPIYHEVTEGNITLF